MNILLCLAVTFGSLAAVSCVTITSCFAVDTWPTRVIDTSNSCNNSLSKLSTFDRVKEQCNKPINMYQCAQSCQYYLNAKSTGTRSTINLCPSDSTITTFWTNMLGCAGLGATTYCDWLASGKYCKSSRINCGTMIGMLANGCDLTCSNDDGKSNWCL